MWTAIGIGAIAVFIIGLCASFYAIYKAGEAMINGKH